MGIARRIEEPPAGPFIELRRCDLCGAGCATTETYRGRGLFLLAQLTGIELNPPAVCADCVSDTYRAVTHRRDGKPRSGVHYYVDASGTVVRAARKPGRSTVPEPAAVLIAMATAATSRGQNGQRQ